MNKKKPQITNNIGEKKRLSLTKNPGDENENDARPIFTANWHKLKVSNTGEGTWALS